MKNKPYEKEPNTCNIPQVDASLYRTAQYNDKRRFISYWHQIHETSIHSSGKILEVGKGNGFISNFLKEMGKDLITLDIDIKLNPDICASVTKVPFKNNAFDTVTCFEILEHLPFENFISTLSELKRVSTKYCLISLPDCRPYYRIYLQIPKIAEIKHLFVPFVFRKPKHFFTGEHYWEIGKANFPVKRILKKIENAGFRIIEHYRVYETPYHHFFILETKNE